MGYNFKLRDGWKGLIVFFGLGIVCLALIVLAYIYLSRKDTVIGVSMLVAAVAAAAAFVYVHVKKDGQGKYAHLLKDNEEEEEEEEDFDNDAQLINDDYDDDAQRLEFDDQEVQYAGSDDDSYQVEEEEEEEEQNAPEIFVPLNRRDFQSQAKKIAMDEDELLQNLDESDA